MSRAVDLHIHSCYSLRDGLMTPRTVVRMAKRLGYDAVAVTDHYDYDGVLRGTFATRRLAAQEGLKAFTGTEYSVLNGHTRGHVLVYFDHPDQAPRRGLDLDGLMDHARTHGLTVVHPHPYGYAGIRDVAFMRRADYVELNGSYRHGATNQRLLRVACEAGLEDKLVANSDAHASAQMGAAATIVAEVHDSVADTLKTKIDARILRPHRPWGKAMKVARATLAPFGLALNAAQIWSTARALAALPVESPVALA